MTTPPQPLRAGDPGSARPPRATVRTARGASARQESLREHNVALVAHAVLDSPVPISRAQVAARTGITRATVSTLVDQLVRARVVTELAPATPTGAGRPAVPLAPAGRTLVGLGLEVNVGHLGARVVDLRGDVVAEHVEAARLHDAPPAHALGRLGEIARALVTEVEAQGMTVTGAALALPGLVDVHARRLQVAPNLGWTTLDPVPLLGLPAGITVEIGNEANYAGLAQLPRTSPPTVPADHPAGADDAPHAPTSYLYVSGDVGIGSAIVLDHEPYLGRHGWSGELGHVVVDPAGPRCRCGAHGCLEQVAGKESVLVAAGLTPSAPLATLVDALAADDAPALAAVRAAGRALGTAVAGAINMLDLDAVLLGGTYAELAPWLVDELRAELAGRVLGWPWAPVSVEAAPVATWAAITGAARTVLRGVVDHPARLLAD
ncbi:putative NBD/HSP70 family sugar kinase [Sediminihabitans luteus]|uniref:Putative NBD/HSP70 family sugar kinase n=1 Tax=Sediminihabitans luteus TaxID=1138585 RepID=A0A2M9CZR2_9CELL|nr:ROK family transcriptional regulator [Sediminihabitans luteus]PJJ77400.1 putative NBD/HSP70 family sugar kinase [Sediminihabitans luteus]GII98293.1 xylose repressor [Sediminihabitans luteus]